MPALQQADAPNGGLGPEVFMVRDPSTDAFVQVSKTRFLVNQFFQGEVFGVPKTKIAMGAAGITAAALLLWWLKSSGRLGKAPARRKRSKR